MATATAKKPPAIPPELRCPHCGYHVDSVGSMPAHVAMAHKDVSARSGEVEFVGRRPEEERDCIGSNHIPGCGHFPPAAQPAPAAPAVLPPAAGAASFTDLPLELVDVGDNVRVEVAELEELAASIAEHGVLQPVKATGPHADGRYLVVWGQRRTLASRMAGRATVPAIVLPPDADVDAHGAARSIEQLVENLHRADLNPIDRARAMRAVVDSGTSQADLARKLGIGASTVSNDLRLLSLEAPIQERILSGELSASHGKAMAALTPRHQHELAARIVSGKMSAHQVEGELEWRRQAAKSDELAAERTKAAIPKLHAALAAAHVEPGARIHLLGPYNMDRDALRAEILKGGYQIDGAYVYDRPPQGKCDCSAFRVEFNRNWKVTPGCVSERHTDRQRNIDRHAEIVREKSIDAKVASLVGPIRAQLERLDRVVVILIAASHSSELPEMLAAKGDEVYGQQLDLAAQRLARTASSRNAWNDRPKADAALDKVVAELGIEAAS